MPFFALYIKNSLTRYRILCWNYFPSTLWRFEASIFYWWHFCWQSDCHCLEGSLSSLEDFMIFSPLIFWGFAWIYLDMNLFYLTMLNSGWFFNLKILIFDSEKKKHLLLSFQISFLQILSYFFFRNFLSDGFWNPLNFHPHLLIVLSFFYPIFRRMTQR